MLYPYYETASFSIYTSYAKSPYSFPSHFHNRLEAVYCPFGMQNIKIGKTVYTLHSGDAMIIFPNTVHEFLPHPHAPEETETIALICNTELLSATLPDILTKYPETPVVKSELISKDTAYAFRKILSAQDNTELLGWTCIILSDIMKSLKLVPTEGNTELPSRIISYINKNFREELTIPEIAKEFGYHPSYIAHLFCDRLKIPFRTYLGAIRSEYAASLIRAGEKNLTEIAYDSGYNSLNTFCRSFKKHFNMTPSEYKKSV